MITDARGVTIRVDRFGQVQLVDTTFVQRFSIPLSLGTNQAYLVTSVPAIRTCRVCGCTDDRACPGGCFWVGPALCSRCQS